MKDCFSRIYEKIYEKNVYDFYKRNLSLVGKHCEVKLTLKRIMNRYAIIIV